MSRQSDLDNHANQLNPNNDTYWESREWDERPDDWEERADKDDAKSGKESDGDKRAGTNQIRP